MIGQESYILSWDDDDDDDDDYYYYHNYNYYYNIVRSFNLFMFQYNKTVFCCRRASDLTPAEILRYLPASWKKAYLIYNLFTLEPCNKLFQATLLLGNCTDRFTV